MDRDRTLPARPDDQGGRPGARAQEPAALERHGLAAADLHHPRSWASSSSWCWEGPRLGRRRNEQQAEVNEIVAERTARRPHARADSPGPTYVASVATLNRNLGAMPVLPGNRVDLFPDYGRVDRGDDRRGGPRHRLGPRGVLHHRVGRRDRPVLRGPRPGRRTWRRRCGCCSTTSGRAASPATRTSRSGWTRPGSSGTRCCRSTRSRASGAAPTCATTARSWSSTGRSRFTGSQNLIEPGYDKPKNHKAGREWVELVARVEGPVVTRAQRAVRHRLVQRDRRRSSADEIRGRAPAVAGPCRRR